ncbi:hypothetical protein C5E16_10785 [Clavibacter michiganensis]|uniref:Uncharacterized protein n=1 Tax=Clavibacter michiganensis TaxID=28447 RepID=A0A2S5VSV6_9MICO|nr:hypothetical protein C5E16_10785 [Clavibacter michiganensis]
MHAARACACAVRVSDVTGRSPDTVPEPRTVPRTTTKGRSLGERPFDMMLVVLCLWEAVCRGNRI